jgi:hypothetical protein
MAREEFFDNLRLADQMLATPQVSSELGRAIDADYRRRLHSADLWLTAKTVAGFDLTDFRDWPREARDRLATEVAAFLEIARKVPADKPATKAQSVNARKHLKAAIKGSDQRQRSKLSVIDFRNSGSAS